jgi:hypothetical protein
MRDQLSNLQIKRGADPVVITDNTPVVSQIIDLQGFNSLTFAIDMGTLSDADTVITALLEESADSAMAGANTVADVDMVSETYGTAPLTAAGFTFASDNQVRSVGYVGAKRYVRLTLTPANNTGNIPVSIMALLGRANLLPVTHATA